MREPDKLVSVIIPVYKVEKYLPMCVDSVLNQTYQNLEVILVDDGSPDNCPAICDDYAQKDKRIRVIHQKNAGLSRARKPDWTSAQATISPLWTATTRCMLPLWRACWRRARRTAPGNRCRGFHEGDTSGISAENSRAAGE